MMAATSARLDPLWTRDVGEFPTAMHWFPDGRTLAVGTAAGEVLVIDAANGTPRAVGTHENGVLAIAVRGDGAELASSGQDGTLAWWKPDGTAVRRIAGARAWIEHLAFQPGGRVLASAAARTVQWWSAEGEPAHAFDQHGGTVTALAWDGGKRLGAVAFGGLWLHTLQGGVLRTEHMPWKASPLAIAFSPNGKTIACGMQDASVHFWRWPGGHHSNMSGYANKVRELAWSANSRHLATGGGNAVVIWDFSGKGPEGTRPLQLEGHTDRISALAFQREGGHLASGGRDWRLSLWRPGSHERALDAHLLGAPVCALGWSPDCKRLAVASENGEVTIYAIA